MSCSDLMLAHCHEIEKRRRGGLQTEKMFGKSIQQAINNDNKQRKRQTLLKRCTQQTTRLHSSPALVQWPGQEAVETESLSTLAEDERIQYREQNTLPPPSPSSHSFHCPPEMAPRKFEIKEEEKTKVEAGTLDRCMNAAEVKRPSSVCMRQKR